MGWTIAWNEADVWFIHFTLLRWIPCLVTYKSHVWKASERHTLNCIYCPWMKSHLPWTQHIWTHLRQLRSQVKWSSLLTCSRYWTVTTPFTIKDMANFADNRGRLKANVSHLETIPCAPRPPPRSHALFGEHQLHMLARLCLKWTNAKIPLYSSVRGRTSVRLQR